MQTTATTNTTNAAAAPFGLNLNAVRQRKSPQAVQLLCIADATGSSVPFARGMTHVMSSIAAALPERLARVRFGLVASRDVDCGEHDDAMLTDGDAQALQHAAGRIEFRGGVDADETHFWSVRDALGGYPWEEGPMRRRAILLMGSSDSKPIPGMSLEQLVLQLGEKRIAVFVVAPRDANLKQLAELTDGLYFELSNDPSAQEVDRLIQRLTASMTQTLTSGGTGTVVAAGPAAGVAL